MLLSCNKLAKLFGTNGQFVTAKGCMYIKVKFHYAILHMMPEIT